MLVKMEWLESASRGKRMGEIWRRMIDTSHHPPQSSSPFMVVPAPPLGVRPEADTKEELTIQILIDVLKLQGFSKHSHTGD